MQLAMLSSLLVAALPAAINAVRVPNSDTPLFNLIATGCDSCGNDYKLVRLNGGATVLTGTGPIAAFYFSQGDLLAVNPSTSNSQPYRALINTQQTSAGDCATYGQFGTVLGSSTNKCATYRPFSLTSFPENAQLGAMLTFNGTDGAFYCCPMTPEVYYKANPDDGPSGCTEIQMFTIPATQNPSECTSSGSGRSFLGLF
ncbi:hypothetical protein EST38_g7739 [Candolleomyces aberdarensis]|uniref:Uncharacterized protein n=1 Tax=Candolleomyces aberdarensis TaxID=2316362 RepID=A0A4Q2DHT3_9AGAR|nr:hypothetical protein EST38_g7739 [Candolleomyces aberdarensis]